MIVTKGARRYLERTGMQQTFRPPVASFANHDFSMHQRELSGPLPVPDSVFDGDPPPDRPLTDDPWPHGDY